MSWTYRPANHHHKQENKHIHHVQKFPHASLLLFFRVCVCVCVCKKLLINMGSILFTNSKEFLPTAPCWTADPHNLLISHNQNFPTPLFLPPHCPRQPPCYPLLLPV